MGFLHEINPPASGWDLPRRDGSLQLAATGSGTLYLRALCLSGTCPADLADAWQNQLVEEGVSR